MPQGPLSEEGPGALRRQVRGWVEFLHDLGAPGLPPLARSAPRGAGSGESLEEIRRDLGDCRRCPLWRGRRNLVFGEGDPHARLMFVGEAPGEEEDRQGRPFVGRAGQLLTRIIEAIGLRREEVYIANILKSRPPGNRDPQPEEVAACSPFLRRQVAAVNPDVLCALGAYAARNLLESELPISRLRGRFHDFHGRPLMPTFHPSYLLRNPEAKREAWEDMKQVRDRLREAGSGDGR